MEMSYLQVFVYFLYFVSFVYFIITEMVLFYKADYPVWGVFIPIYNVWVIYRIAEVHFVWFILLFVPYINLIAGFYVLYNFYRSYGASKSLSVLGLFIPIITASVIAYSEEY